jgi:hypothetical protein
MSSHSASAAIPDDCLEKIVAAILRAISDSGWNRVTQTQEDSLTQEQIIEICADLESGDLLKRKTAIVRIGEACDKMPWRGASAPLLRKMRGLKAEIFAFLRSTCPIYAMSSSILPKLAPKIKVTHGKCVCVLCSILTRSTHNCSTIQSDFNRCQHVLDRKAMGLSPPCGGKKVVMGFHATTVSNAKLMLTGNCQVNVGRSATNTPSSLTTGNRSDKTFFAQVPSFTKPYARDGIRDSTGKPWGVCFLVAAPEGEVGSWTATRQDFTLDTTYARGVNARNVQMTFKGDLDILEVIFFCPNNNTE